ncbi:MAG: sugar transferase [Candidatus Staskawiczbacteria bacterium]|nr:sugar transferase [Candidatus Staskawiczbacteria bacterium]
MIKRIFDFTLALMGLIIFLPLIIFISIAICLEDGWPVLFMQERVGKNGKIFKIIKFRSMKETDNPYLDLDLLKNDPRVTRVGRFLRARAMDELPQLVNILVGQMSFVGPKSLLYSVDDQKIYVKNQSLLLNIKLILISFLITVKSGWESNRKNDGK